MFKILSASVLLGSAVTMFAQIPPPIAPEQINYRHWPEQFIEWIGPELPFTMIELYVDPAGGAKPLYDAVLTERATGKRVHYTNQQQMLELDKRSGAEAYLTTMQLDRPASPATGATYLLRFVDHAGQPVSWQFIQGSDISERGGGSSPAGMAPPVLVYRERSAVAGEGSAVKIGNTVSAADIWTEISQPPYFIAFHGAVSQNVDMAVFTSGAQQWTTIAAPKTLTVGAEWKLKAQDGLSRTLRLQAVTGEHATILDSDEHFPGRTITLEGALTNGAWTIDKMHYSAIGDDPNQGLTILFGSDAKFEVIAGRKTRIATGTLHPDAGQKRVGWEFKDPQWLRGKTAWVDSPTTALSRF